MPKRLCLVAREGLLNHMYFFIEAIQFKGANFFSLVALGIKHPAVGILYKKPLTADNLIKYKKRKYAGE